MSKTLIGPKLRQLRQQHSETQTQMAQKLGISSAYVNLLENNQRSLSVQVLMALSDVYGIDARTFVAQDEVSRLADLRAASRDPVFASDTPDLTELRAAIDHSPRLVDQFLQLHRDYSALSDHVQRSVTTNQGDTILDATPEQQIFRFFRARRNHFPALEAAAQNIRGQIGGAQDDIYALLKRHLRMEHSVDCVIRRLSEMPDSLREFDADTGVIRLSEALDAPNRVFQLAHMVARLEASAAISAVAAEASFSDDTSTRRLVVELTNYVAAAILMPYDDILELAQLTRYDLDRLASAFCTTFEQVGHRLTTLTNDQKPGVPLFFLRIDRAGNVTKRFDSATAKLGEQGGGCPVWNVHRAFQIPNVILSQFVETPDGEKYFTMARTSDRPVFSRRTQDRRLVVALGCPIDHADSIGYATAFNRSDRALYGQIGMSCHTCPRQKCSQRAHQPLYVSLPIDSNRRGKTRYES